MSSTAIISRFFTISATPSGVEVPLLGRGEPKVNSGYIEQIIINQIMGGGTLVTLEIRYDSGNSDEDRLVYQLVDEPYSSSVPVVDSKIRGPFSMLNTDVGPDLFLYVAPNASGILQIRVDMEMHKFN